jgi:NAD(P)-dependent dehydrogenase (short-subunit alcohol dehydrogenase family)
MAAATGRVASLVQGGSRGIGLAITKRLLAVKDPNTQYAFGRLQPLAAVILVRLWLICTFLYFS